MINNEGNNDGFMLIWYYWYKKYMEKKSKRKNTLVQLNNLKKHYNIEAIEPQNSQLIGNQKLSVITEKTYSSSSSSSIFTINPEIQAKDIEEILCQEHQNPEMKEMVNQLYSYYLNSKSVYVIYKGNNDTLSFQSKLVSQVDSLERNESLLESYEKIDNKIEGLEILSMLSEFDGMEVWNAKYKSIPHTYIKIKKYSWTKSMGKGILHPCQPKTISHLPILPRITKFKPSLEKLQPFVSYIKTLEQVCPGSYPSMDSIFEYNQLPYVFVQEGGWEVNIGVLCYFVVFGDPEGQLSKNLVDKWVEENPNTMLARTIEEMNERQQDRHRSQQGLSKGLGILSFDDDGGKQIW